MLPPLYQRWMAQLLDGPLPEETEADCASCPMCGDAAGPLRYSFDPRTKCCTFLPALPNFLLGAALSDESAGRESVRARLVRQGGGTPLGLDRPATYPLARSAGAFGRPRSPACDHYLDGRCAIWSHREATCATWFCKHQRGAVGMQLWKQVGQLLAVVERSLSRWCALQLDVDPRGLARLVTERAGDYGGPHPGHRPLFGAYAGEEERYFQRCAVLVDALAWNDVCRICGPDALLLAESLRMTYRELDPATIPSRLRRGRCAVEVLELGEAVLSGYSPHDPILLPVAVIDVLDRFDGRSTEQVLRAVAEELGLELDPALLRRLVDFGILEPVE